MRVVIIGGTGTIGSEVVKSLSKTVSPQWVESSLFVGGCDLVEDHAVAAS